jgi:hypothetical protein
VQLSIVVFFGLFAAVEIYQSVKNVQLPMPIYLVLGILLAVASNVGARGLAQPSNSTLQDPKEVVGSIEQSS